MWADGAVRCKAVLFFGVWRDGQRRRGTITLQTRTQPVSAIQGPREGKRRERDKHVRGLQLRRTARTLSSWHSPRVRVEKGPGEVTWRAKARSVAVWSEIAPCTDHRLPLSFLHLLTPASPYIAPSPHSCMFQRRHGATRWRSSRGTDVEAWGEIR